MRETEQTSNDVLGLPPSLLHMPIITGAQATLAASLTPLQPVQTASMQSAKGPTPLCILEEALLGAGCLLGLFQARPPALSRPAALHELEIICTPTRELVLLPQKHQPLGSANHQHANQPPL